MSIERVKEIPILDVARRLGIEVYGDNKALCFSHEEDTPSLSFHEGGNYFKCFGCGVGGSVIDLVKLYLNISVGEAISWIEREYGLDNGSVTHAPTSRKSDIPDKKKTLPRASINASAKKDGREYSQVYQDLLSLGDVEKAAAYLEQRGISPDITREAGIRVISLEDAKSLTEKYSMDQLTASGVYSVGKKSSTPYYSLARHTLVIPYYDRDGETILTLQGRDIDGASNHKYQMLPGIETVMYNTQALSGSHSVYLCEGAIDVLSAVQLGMGSAVGIAGVNNFKDEHYSLLEPYEVAIATDADGAGQTFYREAVKRFLKLGKRVRAVDWSKLKDHYGVTAEVKDLNDVAVKADYNHKKSLEPKRFYSELMQDHYRVIDHNVLFESGVSYTPEEIGLLRGDSESMMWAVHNIKQAFNGRLEA